MTTDKGLCGGINSGVVRDIKHTIGNADRSAYEIFCIGFKGEVALIRPFPDIFTRSMTRMATPATWP